MARWTSMMSRVARSMENVIMLRRIGEGAQARPGNGSAKIAATWRRVIELARQKARALTLPHLRPSATSGEADVVIELFNMTVQLQKEIGGELTVEQLDRVYEKCRLTAQGRRQLPESPVKKSSSPAKSSDSPSKVDVEKYHDKTFEYGVHEGHTFQWVYKCEKTYVKSMVTKFKNDTIKDPCLKAFAAYCMARDGKSSDTAYMVQQESEDDEATELYVILDTGCNNTCHGSEWMVKYMKPEASPRWN